MELGLGLGLGLEQGVVDLPPLCVERPRRVGARKHGCGLVGEDDVAGLRVRVRVRVRFGVRVRLRQASPLGTRVSLRVGVGLTCGPSP